VTAQVETTVEALYQAAHEVRATTTASHEDLARLQAQLALLANDVTAHHRDAAAAAEAQAAAAASALAGLATHADAAAAQLQVQLEAWRTALDDAHHASAAQTAHAVRAMEAEAARALATMSTVHAELEARASGLGDMLTAVADGAHTLQGLQANHLTTLQAAQVTAAAVDAQLHGMVRAARGLGAMVAHAVAVARRVVWLAGVLVAGHAAAQALGQSALPVLLWWAWAVLAEVAGPDGGVDAGWIPQWAPAVVWVAVNVLARLLTWRRRTSAQPPATPDATLVPLLVSYIVALRRDGPNALPPPALAIALAEPPPAYTRHPHADNEDEEEDDLIAVDK
jgi:hypothetical protein